MTKNKSSTTYHVSFHPAAANANTSKLKAFLSKQTLIKQEADYVVFASDESRVAIWRACDSALKPNFYYTIACEVDFKIYASTYPPAERSRLHSLTEKEQEKLSVVLSTLDEAVSIKAALKLKKQVIHSK